MAHPAPILNAKTKTKDSVDLRVEANCRDGAVAVKFFVVVFELVVYLLAQA